ncbi:hypothetical protein L207DRAFT_509616 [Hyaloscypha variabilis F]|uniref:Nucleotide-binding leucine-rich repeat (NLR)-like protein n=1 Tax=Hyaloscypha variabilis (strain UAMH 11265 / GT02V1 / F) TaxID=1149755 RepID=NLRN_HYAVF|nr:RecName: Full=Nucleotide-binding leucine-rich repeat (NLR)-like protein [Hyaloscypha variabilis F]PMD43055.1 hypothetical protein L207DRAFT_509616 [Hyaloscypha variabilis F]
MSNTQDSAVRRPSLAPEEYSVGWICAIPTELTAAMAMLDTLHGPLESQPKDDGNNYTLGSIGGHNVVIACLPRYGTNDAAVAGISMQRTFSNLRFGLMVGIGGGIPSADNDIRLGDIAVSLPSAQAGGVIQHDMGKKEDGGFRRTGFLNGPPTLLLTAIAKLRATRTLGKEIAEIVNEAFAEEDDEEWRFPEKEDDILFEDGNELDGNGAEGEHVVQRKERKSKNPTCFYGNISSGNSVIKSAKERRRLAEEEGVICVEMEAAGLMNFFNCMVIRGICDYADAHKHKKWQQYAAAVAAAYAKILLCIISPQALKPHRIVHFSVPFGQNSKFIGREEHLRQVLTALTPEEFERDCQRVAITGLGGVGKTRIALEAAFRIRDKHPDCSVFWISAVNVSSFDAGFLEICRQFKVPGINEDKADVKSLAKAYLSQETAGRWLLIIDSADDLDMLYKSVKESDGNGSSRSLAEYLPFSRKGSILFTTRNHKAATYQAGSNVVTVEEMIESDSLQLLETSLIEKGKGFIEDDAKKLVRHLTNLPLAIKQAAAFINQNKITISNYLEVYESSALSDQALIELLSIDFEDQGRYRSDQNPIISTWLISFLDIQKSNPLAARYLYIMSCVAQRGIPRCLLPPASKFDEIQAIGTLTAYAFITELEDQNSFDIHRLVQLAARNWLKTRGELFQRSGDALKQVSRIFPFFKHENRNICIAYLPHAQHVLTFQDFPEDSQESLRDLLHNIGEYYYRTGKYREAEEFYWRALELKKLALGEHHPDTIGSMNNLAVVYERHGEYAKAESLQRQTLELMKQVFGEGHPDTLGSMNNLALVYEQQGEYAEAEKLQQQTLELRKQALGEDHPSTLMSMNNLATIYEQQGEYAKAESLQRQTLELKQQTLGEDHPSTLASMNNLALVYEHQGEYAKAETLYQQTLKLRKQVLGESHPDTLQSMNNLAIVYRLQGKYIEAEGLQQQQQSQATLDEGRLSKPARKRRKKK